MTSPTPDDAKFVTSEDVVARFEGNFPPGRVTWVKWRILDVENELIGEVPSLAVLDPDSDPETAEGRRVGRVRTLVIDKVLELYRNPDGATSKTQAMDGLSESRSYGREKTGTGPGITFTEDELNRVRLKRKRRPKIGTYGVAPWGVPC